MIIKYTQKENEIIAGEIEWKNYINMYGDKLLILILLIAAIFFSWALALKDQNWYLGTILLSLAILKWTYRAFYYKQNKEINFTFLIDIENKGINIGKEFYDIRMIQEYKYLILIFYDKLFVVVDKDKIDKKETEALLKIWRDTNG